MSADTPWVEVGKSNTVFTGVAKDTGIWETANVDLTSFFYNDPTVLYDSPSHGYDYIKPTPANQLNFLNPTPWGEA